MYYFAPKVFFGGCAEYSLIQLGELTVVKDAFAILGELRVWSRRLYRRFDPSHHKR